MQVRLVSTDGSTPRKQWLAYMADVYSGVLSISPHLVVAPWRPLISLSYHSGCPAAECAADIIRLSPPA